MREGPSPELVRALQLAGAHADPPAITAPLRRVLERSDDPDELERATILLARYRVQWFQLAHITRDLFAELPGASRAFNLLDADLEAADRPELRGAEPGGEPRFLTVLLAADGEPVRIVDTKRALNQALVEAQRSAELDVQSALGPARRFLSLEAGWRYSHQWTATVSRVEEILGFIESEGAGPLRDNAWVMLRLGFDLALARPSLPRRQLLDAAARVLGAPPDKRGPADRLVKLGAGEGETLPEQVWSGWRGLRLRVASRLGEVAGVEPSTDGRRLHARLSAHLGLGPPPESAPVEALYTVGESVRREAVARWLRDQDLLPIHDSRAVGQLERKAPVLAARPGRFDAVWVMTLLAVQEAVARRLGPGVRGRAIRLVERGPFGRRSLVLPGGVVFPALPERVARCLRAQVEEPECLRTLIDDLVKRAAAKTRPEE